MSLEERIKVLEEIEEIKKLKARYTFAVDTRDWDYVLSCYTDDAVFDLTGFAGGVYRGKKELTKFFKEDLESILPFMIHLLHNPVIEVDLKNNTAKGEWYYFEPVTWGTTDVDRKANRVKQAGWIAGKYMDEYVKINGQWKFKSTVIKFFYQTKYSDGWAKTNYCQTIGPPTKG